MKLKAVFIVSTLIIVAVVFSAIWAAWAGGAWLLSGTADQLTIPAPTSNPEPITPPLVPTPTRAERYESVAAYFKAGNPNATTYRLGEPWIDRKSFSLKQRNAIHKRNGGCCQVCGSTHELEAEHRRGLQNGGGNEDENIGTLCHDCHVQKTAMDKSLRRQREKLLKQQ